MHAVAMLNRTGKRFAHPAASVWRPGGPQFRLLQCHQSVLTSFSYTQAEGSKSDRKAEKASALTQQYMTEMYNAKNAYLLSIEVSNRMRDKYFEKDLPGIHNVSMVLQASKDPSSCAAWKF